MSIYDVVVGGRGTGRLRLSTAVVLILALLGAGCSGGDETGDSAPSSTSAEGASGGSSATPPPSTTVTSAADESPDAEPGVLYSADFSAPLGEAWYLDGVDHDLDAGPDSSGQGPFLGLLGPGRAEFGLFDLPAHEVITVEMDVYVIGDWRGGLDDGDDNWRLAIDGHTIIETTFSNGDGEQFYPDNIGLGVNEPRSAADGIDVLGMTDPDGVVLPDTTYHLSYTFLHSGESLVIDFEAVGLDDLEYQSWAVANMEVTSVALDADRSFATDLELDVVDGQVTVSGVVPGEREERAVITALERYFEENVIVDGLTMQAGPQSLWLYSMEELVDLFAKSDALHVELGEEAALVSGAVRTTRWREELIEATTTLLGEQVAPEYEIDVLLNDSVVDEVEALRLRFDTGSSVLGNDDRQALDELVAFMNDNEDLKIDVEGHTDTVGDEETNRLLSIERASTAYTYLLDAGVAESRLRTAEFRYEDPEADREDDDALALNRRVTFFVSRG